MQIWPLLLLSLTIGRAIADRTFAADYKNDTFVKDGQPFRYIAGNMHYFQIPYKLWPDRMQRVKALGCNVLQTYVVWNVHEPEQKHFRMANEANLTAYLEMAQKLNFSVVLRVGPYIDAEQDFGGLPYWLLKNDGLKVRSMADQRYLDAVQAWFEFLLPSVVKPMLYENGGPVLMVQVENEYGSYKACDHQYTKWLTQLIRKHLGDRVQLYTTDAMRQRDLECGVVDNVLPTIDFGTVGDQEVDEGFRLLRKFLPKGPMVNSEFYPGWLDKWGDKRHNTTPASDVMATMRRMWSWNSTSFTFYPVHGGTNWGYQASGEGEGSKFQGVTTSYDFDAPISEAGDITPKYLAIRQLIEELTGTEISEPVPECPKKFAYGDARLESMGSILDLMHSLTDENRIVNAKYPLSMEQLNHPYGFIIYETILPKSVGRLDIGPVRDRAYIMIDDRLDVVYQRGQNDSTHHIISLPNKVPDRKWAYMRILVENQGRLAYGPEIDANRKGLIANVTLNGEILTNWTMYPIDLTRVYQFTQDKINQLIRSTRRRNAQDRPEMRVPNVYYGYFFAGPTVGDTYFDPTGWGKGQLFVNGRNIGRYWPKAGPQVTLYLPGTYLSGFNQIYLFELDQAGNCDTEDRFGCWVKFVDKPKYL